MNDIFLRATNISLRYPIDLGMKAQGATLWNRIMGLDYERPAPVSKPVLENISIDLKAGDRAGVVGHNGAGKSTLLKVLSGGIPPQKGKVEANGKIVSFINRTQGVSLEATGYENIILRGLYLGFSIAEMRNKAPSIIEFSELGSAIHKPVRTYSAGMRTRLVFSILMTVEADILLLDEWLGTGDRNFQAKAAEAFESLLDNTAIVVVATHNDRLRERMCNKTIRLEKGRIMPELTPDQAKQSGAQRPMFDDTSFETS